MFTAVLVSVTGTSTYGQKKIGDFVSVVPGSEEQGPNLILPPTHEYQVLIQADDLLTLGGKIPYFFDFTGYVPIDGSSRRGYVSINCEQDYGGVTVLRTAFDYTTGGWRINESGAVNLLPVVGTSRNCSGCVTPWNTILTCEENAPAGDSNGDGYDDFGWITEIDPATRKVVDADRKAPVDKLWAAGRFRHENAAVNLSGTVLYTGADEGNTTSFLYKLVPDEPRNFTSGKLYTLKLQPGYTGWVEVPNTTQYERNHTGSMAMAAGGTSFHGIEDVEIGPDGLIYFSNKMNGLIFRFEDLGDSVRNFIIFAGGMNYTIDYGYGTQTIPWGKGIDNLAFDGEGNLWALQDGGHNHIWVIRKGHTQASPRVELFGRTPDGCEPTGITFSPDYRYMFISMMHPGWWNTAPQTDALGNTFIFNRDAALIIARKEYLGEEATPAEFTGIHTSAVVPGVVLLSWSALHVNEGERFHIFRSTGEGPHAEVTVLEGISQTDFSFLDEHAPQGEVNYYIVWEDGETDSVKSATSTVTVAPKNEFSISELWPNPASGTMHLAVWSAAEEEVLFEISDDTGKIISSEIRKLSSGLSQYDFSLEAMAPGLYFLKFEAGDSRWIRKFVVQ